MTRIRRIRWRTWYNNNIETFHLFANLESSICSASGHIICDPIFISVERVNKTFRCNLLVARHTLAHISHLTGMHRVLDMLINHHHPPLSGCQQQTLHRITVIKYFCRYSANYFSIIIISARWCFIAIELWLIHRERKKPFALYQNWCAFRLLLRHCANKFNYRQIYSL